MIRNIKNLAAGLGLTFGLAGMAMAEEPAPRIPNYGTVMQGNAAVDFTIADYLIRPHLINELQFISGYTGAAGFIDGAFSFKGAGINWFGSMANNTRAATISGNTTISRVKAGMGFGETFGAGLLYEFNKVSQEANDGTTTTEASATQAGDAYGLFGSFNLGFISLWGEFARVTGPDATTEAPGADNANTSTNVILGAVKDTEGEGSHALAVTLGISLQSKDDEAPALDTSGMMIGINLNHGIPLKYSDNLGVFVGGIVNIAYSSSENKTADYSSSGMYFSVAPNIEFQKTLGKGFEISMGSSVNLFNWVRGNFEPDTKSPASPEVTFSGTETGYNGPGSGNLSFGLRWAKENFAVEGELSKALILNGPDFIGGNDPGVLASGGASLSF